MRAGGLLLLGAVITMNAAAQAVRQYEIKEVEIIGSRPGDKTPITKERVSVADLEKKSIAWDVPTLLQGTPSLFVTSDGGVMGGYTAFSIRGVDATRVNISNMGVPLNDSESQTVFWANMPDYGSRLEEIIIVRGAGVSSFGAGAFGATMDMRGRRPSFRAGGRIATYLGSYGLNRNYLNLETGHIGGGWAFSGYLSKIKSDGYVDRSGGNGLAYYAHASHRSETTSLDIIHNSGTQKTGIAWNGLSDYEKSIYGRRYNSAGHINPSESEANPFLAKYYDNTDNYQQSHTYAIFKHILSPEWRYGVTLHYTKGYGYTNEYRTGRRLREYGLAPMDVKTKTSLIRNKYLDNHFYGAIAHLEYAKEALRLTAGLSANRFTNAHYGTVDYVLDPTITYTPGQEYYRNNSTKIDLSAYLKGEYSLSSRTFLYADLMYRHINHTMKGPSDKYNRQTGTMDILDYNLDYNFFLPKVGITHTIGRYAGLYASVAMAGKEPTRKSFTESRQFTDGVLKMPTAEYMIDYELGLNLRYKSMALNLNGYFMDYKDQLVASGSISDVGEPILINVPKSYRAGIETSVTWDMHRSLFLQGNLTLSANKIKDFELVEADEDGDNQLTEVLKSTTIAKSPSIIFNHIIGWSPIDALQILLTGHYVGKQYLDNSSLDGRSIPAYYTSNLKINYTYPLAHERRITLSFQVNNLYNKEYVTTGWASGYYKKSGDDIVRKEWTGYHPAAPIHFVGGVTIDF